MQCWMFSIFPSRSTLLPSPFCSVSSLWGWLWWIATPSCLSSGLQLGWPNGWHWHGWEGRRRVRSSVHSLVFLFTCSPWVRRFPSIGVTLPSAHSSSLWLLINSPFLPLSHQAQSRSPFCAVVGLRELHHCHLFFLPMLLEQSIHWPLCSAPVESASVSCLIWLDMDTTRQR